MDRRLFGKKLAALATAGASVAAASQLRAMAANQDEPSKPNAQDTNLTFRRGVLLGGLIGDALGGPIEFLEPDGKKTGLADARSWSDSRRLDSGTRRSLSENLPLHDYKTLRPDTAPYGPWVRKAPAGTLTDDSRHKVILMQAIRTANRDGTKLSPQFLAEAFLDFRPVMPENEQAVSELEGLVEEGLREYRYAARWLLGERDIARARPLERLWAGVNNCSGQMLLPPLALAYAGEPERAYRKAFEIDFIDAPLARDIASALVAGVAEVVSPENDALPPGERWNLLLNTMRSTDPFEISKVPFAGRPLLKWMDKAKELVKRAAGRPKILYELLETEGEPVYWWDAHFTLLVPLCMMELCELDALAAMHLTLDFGRDTDSYAQVLGCIAGAIYGEDVFPDSMVAAVSQALERDYGEDVAAWNELLQSQRWSRE